MSFGLAKCQEGQQDLTEAAKYVLTMLQVCFKYVLCFYLCAKTQLDLLFFSQNIANCTKTQQGLKLIFWTQLYVQLSPANFGCLQFCCVNMLFKEVKKQFSKDNIAH